MSYLENIKEAANYIREKTRIRPKTGLILGSGLGILADEIENSIKIQYKDIPHFPQSTVVGHKGQLVIGNIQGKEVIALQGRFHYYEGYSMKEVTFPVRVMNELGIDNIIITNAAGGANKNFEPGDLMIIEDHINFAFDNPLIGKNSNELGPRFPDMSHAYDEELINIAEQIATKNNIEIQKGVYMFLTGPTYETPAEVKMAQILGADSVGMSTVPEVVVAIHGGLKVLGISCITNMASGILDKPLDHNEVIETTQKVKNKFMLLIKEIIKEV
ncbi:purine-nucleoside phosphorylase [Clostridium sp. D2Q-14]|uniref:purine-nucleoside phosphorylase n=1 Tax=Anaeromonas gelatinilytica TaxID=2683194 RepID=UPI00193B7EA2|nr:purine-nucleoside phosphorylase [Anaeromonas gelatinilytica]MBS4536229.1 purine-nucleoside phosphorylase [Anaeromonas gelatinilytica]